MTYKEHRSVDGHKIGFVITMKDTDVFPTMGLCNNAASTICDIIQIDPRVNSDHNAPAAAAVNMVRDLTDELDYALRQSLYQIPCRTATR